VPDDPIAQLCTTLHVSPAELAMLEQFAPDDVAALAAAVDRAVAVQRAEIDESLEAALGIVPRPLRGRARKLLFPGDSRG
jgi:hypothetical protein